MTCELKHNAYQDLYKKGEFFQDNDQTKNWMEKRLKTIQQAVKVLDESHKQTLSYMREIMNSKKKKERQSVVLNKKDINEILDTKQANYLSYDKEYLLSNNMKTALHETQKESEFFITTSDLWNDNNLMSFVERNSEDGRYKLRQESLKKFQ